MEYTFNQGNSLSNDEVSASERSDNMSANQVSTASVDDSTLTCLVCNKVFAHRRSLNRHLKTHVSSETHVCDVCGKGFFRKYRLEEHMNVHNKPPKDPKQVRFILLNTRILFLNVRRTFTQIMFFSLPDFL